MTQAIFSLIDRVVEGVVQRLRHVQGLVEVVKHKASVLAKCFVELQSMRIVVTHDKQLYLWIRQASHVVVRTYVENHALVPEAWRQGKVHTGR